MYAQFFGSYLLSRGVITTTQLTDAITKLTEAKIKLGTLAIHQGLMTASEVDEVCYLQTREDKKFGEIAIERNYLTSEQVDQLLESQNPDYLLLGQNLVDSGAISNADLEGLFLDYQSDTDIEDFSFESQEQTEQLIRKFFLIADHPLDKHGLMYMTLLFNNLIRFIGDDFTPIAPAIVDEYPTEFCVSQKITGPLQCISRVDMPEEVIIDEAELPLNAIGKQIYAKQHYSLSADELEAIFPDLVYENEDGTKSINYVEMVPILVQAIGELSAKVAELEGKDSTVKKVSAKTTAINDVDGSVEVLALGQNKPNPFGTSTEIEVSVPESVQSAFVYVYDLQGKKVQQVNLTARGRQTVQLNAADLTDGMYLYSLIADGKVVETRRMIVEK